MLIKSSRLASIVSTLMIVHPHEIQPLLHASSCFFFILGAYFAVLPLRDEGAISLGLSNLPGLFLGSLLLTLVAAPLSAFIFSIPNYSKSKALVLVHRFFGVSLIVFFILWRVSSVEMSPSKVERSGRGLKSDNNEANHGNHVSWENHGWLYISVRIGLFLWVALLNLVAISSTWARVIDVMDNESGSRLFGLIGAGATLGQLFGSLFAAGMAWLGPYLLLFAALLMELAARASRGIDEVASHLPKGLSQISKAVREQEGDIDGHKAAIVTVSSPITPPKTQIPAIFDGLRLILASSYLLHVSAFLWLSAVVSSFFYFQKVNIIAVSAGSSLDRRRLLAQINSFIAVFVLTGQLTLTGRLLSFAGLTVAISAAPAIAFGNLLAFALWPTWVAVAVSETVRKVVTYVVTRPGRELLFTVVSQDEKYKAKICIDVIVQRLGDAAAAGLYKVLFNTLHGQISAVSLYALPACLIWIAVAISLGRRQKQLATAVAESHS